MLHNRRVSLLPLICVIGVSACKEADEPNADAANQAVPYGDAGQTKHSNGAKDTQNSSDTPDASISEPGSKTSTSVGTSTQGTSDSAEQSQADASDTDQTPVIEPAPPEPEPNTANTTDTSVGQAMDAGSSSTQPEPGPPTGDGITTTNRDDFFGASRCDSSFDLCDGFEDAALDTNLWEPRGGTPEIDTTRAARGNNSVHFHTDGNGLQYITERATFPANNNTYYARIFVYFDAMPTAPMWAHWTIAGANGSGTDAEIRVGGQWDGKVDRFGVGTDGGPTGDWTWLDDDPNGNASPVPVGEWVCLEWLHKGDTNETRLWWDGVEHESLHTTEADHGGEQAEPYQLPTFEELWFGWWLYQADPEPNQFDVWMDEIAIASERIGCGR